MDRPKRLTDTAVLALKARKQRYEVFDGSGFGIRVSPRSIKTWVWVYRFQGRTRRLTLGTYPKMKVADAHIAVAEARKALAEGKDPAADNVAARKAERQAETVAELAEEYMERYSRPRKRSAPEDERILKKDILPFWGRRKARDINRRDVVLLLDRVVDRGAAGQAVRVLSVVSTIFTWAMQRQVVDFNPAWKVAKPAQVGVRDRVLSDGELRSLWTGLDTANMAAAARLVLRLQLVTGQRVGEVAELPWTELDLEEGIWSLPADRSKNKRAHRIPLSGMALDLLDEARGLAQLVPRLPAKEGAATPEAPKWVFPSPAVPGMHITPGSVMRLLNQNLVALRLQDVHTHDLRRTAATGMAAAGVPPSIIGRVLNHTEPGVTARHYDQHVYDAEKRAALEKWARKLKTIIDAGAAAKVVPIRA